MEAKKEKKYMSDIHLEDYTEQYETCLLYTSDAADE